jgi:tetratricopeptide (TPR) repeat protein
MSPHYERAWLLYQQSRYDLAEKELAQALAEDPNDGAVHALRSLCLNQFERHAAATQAAHEAIALAPNLPLAHYALGHALLSRNHLAEAERAAMQAIECDPTNPEFFTLLGMIRFNRRDWAGAMEAADQGLQFDGEHAGCVNVRAMALVQLGRRGEASETIEGALARDPENAFSHANQGWAALHAGASGKALEHFREALRLDPEFDWARSGMVEALKARYLIYRLMLRFFLWLNRFSVGIQLAIILGFVFLRRALQQLARDNPALAPFIWPVLIGLIAFFVLTWIADPLFNLLLRLNRFGRYALSRDQVVASNWVGICLLAALAALAWALIADDSIWLLAALLLGLMVLTVAGVFKAPRGWPRRAAAAAALLLAGLAALGMGLLLSAFGMPFRQGEQRAALAHDVLMAYIYGSIAFSWLCNALIFARPKQ